jgi:hypothetical protein
MEKVVKILDFPRIHDPRGSLTFLQNNDHFPFEIQRVFWTYDVPGGEIRGGHAYRQQEEVIIALSGSFDVVITKPDRSSIRYHLSRSFYGIYIPPLTWRHIESHSTNSLSLHLSSLRYDSSDYIRDFDYYARHG